MRVKHTETITPFGFKVIYGIISVILVALITVLMLSAVWYWY